MSTGIFINRKGVKVELTQQEVDALEASNAASQAEDAARELAIKRAELNPSRAQFWTGLALNGIIAEADAESMVADKTIPASVQAYLDTLPADQQFPARMFLKGALSFERNNALIEDFAANVLGLTPEQTDALFEQMVGLSV